MWEHLVVEVQDMLQGGDSVFHRLADISGLREMIDQLGVQLDIVLGRELLQQLGNLFMNQLFLQLRLRHVGIFPEFDVGKENNVVLFQGLLCQKGSVLQQCQALKQLFFVSSGEDGQQADWCAAVKKGDDLKQLQLLRTQV